MQGRSKLPKKEIRITSCDGWDVDFEIVEIFSVTNRQSDSTVARRYLRLALAQVAKHDAHSLDAERLITSFIARYEVNKIQKQNKLKLKLPADSLQLKYFFAAIDHFVMHIQYCAEEDGHDIDIFLNGELLPRSRANIARKLAVWFDKKVKRSDNSELKQAMQTLAGYWQHPTQLLSTQIMDDLYPPTSLAPMIAKITKNELEQTLTHPDTTYQSKAFTLLTWLKNTLQTKSPKDARNEEQDAAIHAEINQQLASFAALKTNVWNIMIKSVFGKPACDGGLYEDKYEEIKMLLAADLSLNANGEFELDYTRTPTYQQIYAPTKQTKPDLLKTEITTLFKYLNMQFKPEQDFHQKIIFSRASNQELMRRGLGWTKPACVHLLKSSFFFNLMNYEVDKKEVDNHSQKFFASLIVLR